MTNEMLGFLTLILCMLWSLAMVYLIGRLRRNGKRKYDNLDNDLHH